MWRKWARSGGQFLDRMAIVLGGEHTNFDSLKFLASVSDHHYGFFVLR